MGLQALETALHPCWSRFTAPYHAAPCSAITVCTHFSNPTACTSGSDGRVDAQALSRCLESSRLSSDAVCCDCPGDDNSVALSDTPDIYELPLHLGWAFHWHRKDSAESPAAGNQSRTQTLARRKLLLLWLSPQSAVSTMTHPLVHMLIFQHTLPEWTCCMYTKHTPIHTSRLQLVFNQ